MTKNRLYSILREFKYTNFKPPGYKDGFWEVRGMIEAWNKNMERKFTSSWLSCLDKSMGTWINKYTCPGFMFFPRKPWPFGNEYHSVCCGETGVMWGIELVEGNDRPPQLGLKEFNKLG